MFYEWTLCLFFCCCFLLVPQSSPAKYATSGKGPISVGWIIWFSCMNLLFPSCCSFVSISLMLITFLSQFSLPLYSKIWYFLSSCILSLSFLPQFSLPRMLSDFLFLPLIPLLSGFFYVYSAVFYYTFL